MTSLISYESEGPIGTLILNRPDQLNTMNSQLLHETLECLELVANNDQIRVLIVTGAGSAFCAGGDLSAGLEEVTGPPPLTRQTGRLRGFMRTSQLLRDMPKITIAAINGACAGAGLSWACACDLRYASSNAVFNTAFLKAGVSGDFGGTWSLTAIVGPAKARELYLLAERFDAEEALRIGLVTDVLTPDELISHVQSVAQNLAQAAPVALRLMKQNFLDSSMSSFVEMLDMEAARHAATVATDDAAEAAKAYLGKRAPQFRGR